MDDKFKCGICGKTFKSESGLSGHMRFSHDEQRIKTTPDQIGKRLEALELAGASNPGQKVDTQEGLVTTLRLLLPAIERFGLAVVSLPGAFNEPKKYRIVKNSDIRGGMGRLNLCQEFHEL